jgi:hypothetical protein
MSGSPSRRLLVSVGPGKVSRWQELAPRPFTSGDSTYTLRTQATDFTSATQPAQTPFNPWDPCATGRRGLHAVLLP